jgi:hypothetical protein
MIREARVVGFMPSNSAAPTGPYIAVRLPQGCDNRALLPAFEFLAHEKKGLRGG